MDIVVPEAKGKVTCSGNELTIMYDTDDAGLFAHLRTIPSAFALKVFAVNATMFSSVNKGTFHESAGRDHHRDRRAVQGVAKGRTPLGL